MSSPVFFLLVSLAMSSAMLSVIFLMAWLTQGRLEHARTWSITFAIASLQWLINIFNESFPSREVYWLIANGVMLAGVTIGLLGHFQRVGRNVEVARLVLPAVAAYILIAWFTIASPHIGLQIGLGPAYAALTMFVATRLILQHRRKPRVAEWGAAITIGLFGLNQSAAALAGFLQGPTVNPDYMNAYYMINFLGMPAAYTGMGMFVIFMLASDLSEKMKEIAIRDQLTGLLNRRGFTEAASAAYATARRTDRIVSVVMTDIDKFKDINDQFGHSAGDLALCHFADILSRNRRTEDILARIGGEEFALVLPGATVEQAIKIAENLCRKLADTPMDTELEPMQMTASFGVASISINDTCLTDVVVRADAALYRSKRAGRNRIDLESSQMMLRPDGQLEPITS